MRNWYFLNIEVYLYRYIVRKHIFVRNSAKERKLDVLVNLSCLFWSNGFQKILFLPENVAILCLICDLTKNKYNCNILKKGTEASVVLISITDGLYHVRAYAAIVSCRSLYMNQASESLFLHNARLTQKYIWRMCYPLKSHDCRIKYISNVRNYINVVVKLCND